MPQCSNSCGDDFHSIVLESVTIFWEDLGIPTNRSADMNIDLSEKWDREIGPWLKSNITNHVNPHSHGVWFSNKKDAMFFKLTWSGRMLD